MALRLFVLGLEIARSVLVTGSGSDVAESLRERAAALKENSCEGGEELAE